MPPGTRLLDMLSDDVLELIADKLDWMRHKLAFTSSCRRLRALRDSSTRLWASLRVMGDKPTHSQLPVFLARGPKHVRELVLCAHVKLEGLYPEQVEEQGKLPVYDPAVIQGMLISVSLVGLDALVLQWPGELGVGGWVQLMPNLRRLCLYPCYEAYHQKLVVTTALAALLRLETFCFASEQRLEMEDRCLPRSLRTLCLTWSSSQLLPSAVASATQLRSLSLRDCRGNLRVVERLSQLTYLHLAGDFWEPDTLPPLRLAALPALQCLKLTDIGGVHPLSLDGPSRGLQQLTYMSLPGVTLTNQPSLCAQLSTLTSLQVLDTSWAGPPVLTPAALSGMQQLRAVSLHLKTAAETASSLQALPRLELLFLHWYAARIGVHSSCGPKTAPIEVAALLEQLAGCTALKRLFLADDVRKLLTEEEHQLLCAPALAKLSAAGVEMQLQPVKHWRDHTSQMLEAAAGVPAEADQELAKLRLS